MSPLDAWICRVLLPLPGKALEHQPGDARDIAELTARDLAQVDAGEQVLGEVARRQAPLEARFVHAISRRRQQLEAVIVGVHGKGLRLSPRPARGDERRDAFVRQPAAEGIDEQMKPFAAAHALDEQRVLRSAAPTSAPERRAAARPRAFRDVPATRRARRARPARHPQARRTAASARLASAAPACGGLWKRARRPSCPSPERGCSTRPANPKSSPGFSRPMKDSSTVPSRAPFIHFTTISVSLEIVPMAMRCRRAMRLIRTRMRPSSARDDAAILRIALQRRPPRVTKSSAQRHSASLSSAIGMRVADFRQQLVLRRIPGPRRE